ncbi:50S ribosomal protein L24 [Candidatus Curculioniphilus buchneri]|uniref:50S ribosomal protein L24 n=1 Tax=Candidatus Curculioniphilus buchneri TaxID=690594 RepID=UPI00376EF366
MAAKIRCGDEVIVLNGRDKGKRGKVIHVLSTGKAVVEGIHLVKKHQKPLPAMNRLGGIVEIESVIDLSNLAVFNTVTNKAERIGFRINNGKKMRFLKSNGQLIE